MMTTTATHTVQANALTSREILAFEDGAVGKISHVAVGLTLVTVSYREGMMGEGITRTTHFRNPSALVPVVSFN